MKKRKSELKVTWGENVNRGFYSLIMLIVNLMSGFLAGESMVLGGFEGFDYIHLRDQQAGERSLCSWSKLGQGGERFLPHHSTSVQISFRIKWRKQGTGFGFLCRIGVHCLGKKSLLGTEDTRSGEDLTSEVFSITKAPFLISPGRVFFAYLFIIVPGRIY
jgi:hypothetical protein